jgi:urea transport system ATP-binding protein
MTLAETPNPSLTQSLLYLDGVSVSFDGYKALRSLSLVLAQGEMRAIIGPNGAGKTTMMDVIAGKTRPDEGEVLFDGRHDLTKLDEAEIATLGVGRKFQKPTVFENHTVEDNLLLATKAPRSVRATLFGREDPRTKRSTPSSRRLGSPTIGRGSPDRCRTGRSNGSKSACFWRRTRSCCWLTSRSRG